MWRGDSKVFNLLADPDLVQRGAAEGQGRDDDSEKFRLGLFVDGEGHSNAGCEDGREHVPGDVFAEQYKVDEDNRRRGHDLGELVEPNGVECQAEIAENDVAGEEAADGQHAPDVKAHGFECVEGAESGDEEDEASGGEVPHDYHELACFELLVAEYTVALSVEEAWHTSTI